MNSDLIIEKNVFSEFAMPFVNKAVSDLEIKTRNIDAFVRYWYVDANQKLEKIDENKTLNERFNAIDSKLSKLKDALKKKTSDEINKILTGTNPSKPEINNSSEQELSKRFVKLNSAYEKIQTNLSEKMSYNNRRLDWEISTFVYYSGVEKKSFLSSLWSEILFVLPMLLSGIGIGIGIGINLSDYFLGRQVRQINLH